MYAEWIKKYEEIKNEKKKETEYCPMCERKKEEPRIKARERILNILADMNDYEIKALEEFIHKIGKEYKNKEIKKEIEKLKESLDE